MPAAGIMLIFGIDKFMSECRALVNFYGNAVATLVIAKWDKALDIDQARRVLAAHTAPDLAASDEDWEVLAHEGTSAETGAAEPSANLATTSTAARNGSGGGDLVSSSVAVDDPRPSDGAEPRKFR